MRAEPRARRSSPSVVATRARRGSGPVKAEAAALGAAPAGWRASLALARLLDATGRADEARAARADARRLLERVAAGLTGAPDLLRGFKASPPYAESL